MKARKVSLLGACFVLCLPIFSHSSASINDAILQWIASSSEQEVIALCDAAVASGTDFAGVGNDELLAVLNGETCTAFIQSINQ